MKKLILTCIFVLTTVFFCTGQKAKTDCKCFENKMAGTTKGAQPDTSFHFSNGKTIILCDYKNPDIKPTTFSEFTLSICGQDTIIDFFEAKLIFRFKFKKDTLVIEDIRNLPTAVDRKYQMTTWIIEKIYFTKGKLNRHFATNKKIRKYNQQEIQETIKEYETAKLGLDDSKIELANRLFISTISGNKKARLYFADFETKFGTLDGAFKEEYNELETMLGLLDKEK